MSHVLSLFWLFAPQSDVWFVALISIPLLDERSRWQRALLLRSLSNITCHTFGWHNVFIILPWLLCKVRKTSLPHFCNLNSFSSPSVEETLLVCFPHSSGSFLGFILHKWMYFYLNFYIYDDCCHHKLWEIIRTVKSKCVQIIRFKILPWFSVCTARITELDYKQN